MTIDFVISGYREGQAEELGECVVTIDGQPLDLALDVYPHSPDGFEWGYHGSGPAQLALAIMVEFFKRTIPDVRLAKALAIRFYQRFKSDVIARFDSDASWTLTGATIQTWLYKVPESAYTQAISQAVQEVMAPIDEGDDTSCDCT